MIELDHDEAAKLAKCFRPESAAIVGASTDPMKFGGRALKFCLERGYQGRLYPVNAKHAVDQGVDAFASIADLPEAPDVAVIAVPAPLVKDNLVAAGEKGAKVAIVYGAQFAEAGGKGVARQAELLDIARAKGMRLIGPNCMGVMSLASGFIASFSAAPEHHNGKGWPDLGSLSVASQSGAVGIQMFAQLRDRGIGLANWISTGNQADIDVADAIAYFAADPTTKTIAAYMEDASRGLKLVQALECARAAAKPVVILKVGTTELGGIAAAGHTASMYVEDQMVDDLFKQYGVLRAGSINELIDLVAACNAGVLPRANDVAAVSVSGGGAVMISDAVAGSGLSLSAYSSDALAQLKADNPFVNDRNPIDISAPSMSNMAITGGHLKWGTAQGSATMLGYISHIPLVPRTRPNIMPQLLELPSAHPEQLVAIAGNFHADDRKALVQAGVSVFDDPTVATQAVGKLVSACRAQAKPSAPPASARDAVQNVRDALAEAGVHLVETTPVESLDDALQFAASESEVVLKLNAPTLTHRTELGGVRTALAHADSIRSAYEHLSAVVATQSVNYPGLHIVAQPHVRGVEMLVGVRQDPHFGPIVVVGSGGTLCELVDDLCYRKTPFGREDAEAMLASVRASRMLDGWRGAPAVDRGDLTRTILALADLAPALPALEINPLIVTETGALGVDLVIA
ncbi:MAG: acetate--CoA ligase family protein [Pseudomonadota bacterium]